MKIGIVMGGISSEREISLKTGEAMYNILNEAGKDVEKILINKVEDVFDVNGIDFALLSLHGKFGEDGAIQSYFDLKNIPYSGCGALASAVCMDKNITKAILRKNNIPTANWITVKSMDELDSKLHLIEYPVFVKPNSGGSSVATFKVTEEASVFDAVFEALKWDTEVMIETFKEGIEITCAILDGKVLPTIKIDSKGEFFDFQSKYSNDGADEYAVFFEQELQERINEYALRTYNVLGCEVYGRVDMILYEKDINILEVNTLPGMTNTSLFPKAAEAYGMSVLNLLETIISKSVDVRIQKIQKAKDIKEMEMALV